jgi:hypothetical protein
MPSVTKPQLQAALRLLKDAYRLVQDAQQPLAADNKAVTRLERILEQLEVEVDRLDRLLGSMP